MDYLTKHGLVKPDTRRPLPVPVAHEVLATNTTGRLVSGPADSMAADANGIPLLRQAVAHGQRAALVDGAGEHSYASLFDASGRVATFLLAGESDLREARVAFMVPPSREYVAVQWGIWRAGGVAVPLCVSHPPPEIEYVLSDAAANTVVAHPEFQTVVQPMAARMGLRFILTTDAVKTKSGSLPAVVEERRAMMLYTSGTTSKPKGVVTTHRNITAQITSLVEAWEWTSEDRILHVLPLHHIHGIINILSCALWSGAVCELLTRFDAEAVWRKVVTSGITLFMAVPTIYQRLIASWESAPPAERERRTAACGRMRLMVSGSAALPVSMLERWREITGHTLLERYGMTEIGMALSNPLRGERRAGFVGTPLPGVQVRLVDDDGQVVEGQNLPGEIQIKSDNVFLEYWRRPEATRDSFSDGWFRTGDQAVVEQGYYRILGRSSVDIIKTGGYKVSALEIEETLRTHPLIKECAVVGVEDPEWGECVSAAVVLSDKAALSLDELRAWGKGQLAHYKVPTRLRVVTELPRNTMGKVTKPEVKKLFPR